MKLYPKVKSCSLSFSFKHFTSKLEGNNKMYLNNKIKINKININLLVCLTNISDLLLKNRWGKQILRK